MSISDLVKLLRKHLVLLLLTPIVLAGLVVYLTKHPNYKYSSETTLFTGIASGSSVEMGKSLNYFATNTDFDNLINVINSRETQQEVALRLLAQHLMLPKYDSRYISKKSFDYIKGITPNYINSLIGRSLPQTAQNSGLKDADSQAATSKATNPQIKDNQKHIVKDSETLYAISRQYNISVDQIRKLNGISGNNIRRGQTLLISQLNDGQQNNDLIDSLSVDQKDTAATFSFLNLKNSLNDTKTFPSVIDPAAFEITVKNLTDLVNRGDTNFVYNLLNYNSPHYSINIISEIDVQRVSNSDLVRLKYTSDDPGICQQTLVFFTEVCIKNYRKIKENNSDAVVKYFEFQVNNATQKLNRGEEKLLSFNKDNSIINYYEQSKAIAGAKEALDVDYNNMRIKLAGTEAAITRLEEKLVKQQNIQLESAPIIDKRNQLSQINTKIATAETIGYNNTADGQNLASLKAKAEELKEDIRKSVTELYRFSNSTDGIPLASLLNDWITNVLIFEETKAGLGVLSNRIREFQKQYEIYAPAGANLKRIEREIAVSEQEYLELLNGLNLAKLKMQDIELSSNLKSIDQPYYPLTPNPTKRKFIIAGSGLFGFLIVLTIILALEFFDETLRNPKRASKILNLNLLGIFPKIYLKPLVPNLPSITQRLVEMIAQNIELLRISKPGPRTTYQILLFSTQMIEGKTVITQNLASQLKKLGNKVIVIRYSHENSLHQQSAQNYCPGASISTNEPKTSAKGFSLISWLLGYADARIDYRSPILCDYGSTLSKDEFFEFEINEDYHRTTGYKELLSRSNYSLSFVPDYVLIEIPPVLYYPYPVGLVASIDLPVMVCRANREWSEADQSAAENIAKVTSCPPQFVLNGVGLDAVESVLGGLSRKKIIPGRKKKNLFVFNIT